MGTRNLFLLAEDNLQSRLIEEQLSSLPNVEVKTCLPGELTFHSNKLNVDLIFMDHDLMKQFKSQYKLPDFDLFGWPIMIHNVPNVGIQPDLLSWKMLKGILLRNAPIKDIRQSIEYVLDGGLWLPRKYLEKLVNSYRHADVALDCQKDELTSRERQILSLLAYGISNQQIASKLFVSESTVKSHIYKLYKKLDVHSRHDAIKLVRTNSGLTSQFGEHRQGVVKYHR
ncbi:response regulator transcription factor [Vibrio mytili]|uniref:helix-turn-helix transcriptional regulator n=1 Tax=Vibrio mytili TaxID=50718 RepID=UPI0006960F34|nr:response regulator transcription factor [Vibrio mytili]